ICDFSTTFGNFRFYTECVNNGIKPVIGLEIKYKSQVYLFYAKNHNGIIRLNQLNSKFLIDGNLALNEVEPDIMLILERGEIVDSIIDNKSNKEKLNILKKKFKEDFYIGFITNVNEKSNFLIHEVIMKQNIKFINVDEVRFLRNKDLEIYTTLKAIKETKKVKDLAGMKSSFSKYCIKKNEKNPSDSIIEFVNKIDIEYPKKELKPPKFKFLPNNLDSTEFLKQLAYAGLNKRRNFDADAVYQERLDYELDVIINMGFADYFLIVWDIVKYAKTNNIYVGAGRGSAAGSLVSYCLGITEIDPISNNLIFERFLNPQRVTMPDIDIDFEDVKRNDVVEYIVERFGSEYVCKIATVSKFLAKSTFKDVAKAWNIDSGRIESISKKLNSKLSFMENLKENNKLRSEVIGNLELERIIDIVEKIEGMPRQTSIHAAGIIIGDKKITDYCSVDFDNVAHAEARELEALGLLKIDILALSNLTFIHDIIDKVNLIGGDINLSKISLEDEKVFNLLSEAKTLGIFQMESEGMRKTLLIVKPSSFAEIANVLALYRPGPKEFIAEYVKDRNFFQFKGVIKEIVSDTHGIIIFQEQIMLIATNMAGYTLAQADLLRRAISK
ncbi:MAG: DNA polymerase III subunit alpha, partial [Mycoplasmatales bacterium]